MRVEECHLYANVPLKVKKSRYTLLTASLLQENKSKINDDIMLHSLYSNPTSDSMAGCFTVAKNYLLLRKIFSCMQVIKWLLIAINRIQNKSLCLHNICLCNVYYFVYI